jgi:2-polyprenyl-3-methyl-5-hydroxy-6-metoxy-1,4-benzoquinol methylase
MKLMASKECPFCGGTKLSKVDSKYLVTMLLECAHCHLLHRHPRDGKIFLKKFYEEDYRVDVAMMTNLPDELSLQSMKAEGFLNVRDHFSLIRSLYGNSKIKMVDYGCSWGYNIFKLRQKNIDVVGYELSRRLASFGKKNLDVEIQTDEAAIRPDNDVMFSSHVIEHLYSISDFVELCKDKLRPDGLFLSLSPNGSLEFRQKAHHLFHVNWGNVHPNVLTIDFAQFMFKDNPYLILTSDDEYDLEAIRQWDGMSQQVGQIRDGYELLMIAKPNVVL